MTETRKKPDTLVVFTGMSGSGKSSLAFDTIYAKGQRRTGKHWLIGRRPGYDSSVSARANRKSFMTMVDVYHRKANYVTQSLQTAKLQKRSGEMWGYPHRHGYFPSVKAYLGPLPDNVQGVQFATQTPPDKFTPNNLALWRLPRDGGSAQVEERQVQGRDVAACVKVEVEMCRYNCRELGA